MEPTTVFLVFLALLFAYHAGEVLIVVVYNPRELGWSSLLLSYAYCATMAVAMIEFWIEAYFFPWMKGGAWLFWAGLAAMVSGDVLRKAAMVTAQHNFTHAIAHYREERHVLVTWGVYRYIRHPGYLGWFVWSISSQILLANPVCLPFFVWASWKFFAERIPYEERLLSQFFGDEFEEYRERTPTWIPFIE